MSSPVGSLPVAPPAISTSVVGSVACASKVVVKLAASSSVGVGGMTAVGVALASSVGVVSDVGVGADVAGSVADGVLVSPAVELPVGVSVTSIAIA